MAHDRGGEAEGVEVDEVEQEGDAAEDHEGLEHPRRAGAGQRRHGGEAEEDRGEGPGEEGQVGWVVMGLVRDRYSDFGTR